MSRSVAIICGLALLLAPGCKKKPAENASAPSGGVLEGATVPDSDEARAFAKNLIGHDAMDIKPVDSGEVAFKYNTLDFKAAGNAWAAEAVMGQGTDSVACSESGDWTIESAASGSEATVALNMTKTTCAGRPEKATMRLKLNVGEDGKYTVQWR